MEGREGREGREGPEEKKNEEPQASQGGQRPKITPEMIEQYIPMVENMAKAMMAQIEKVSKMTTEHETRLAALEEHANNLTQMLQDPGFYANLRDAIMGGVPVAQAPSAAPVSISLGAPGNGGGGGGFGGADALDWMKTFAVMMGHANNAAPSGGDGLSQGVQMLGQMFKIFTEFQKTALVGIKDMYSTMGDPPRRPRRRHLAEEDEEYEE